MIHAVDEQGYHKLDFELLRNGAGLESVVEDVEIRLQGGLLLQQVLEALSAERGLSDNLMHEL